MSILVFALHATRRVVAILGSIEDAPEDVQALREDAFQVHGRLNKVLDPREWEEVSGLRLVARSSADMLAIRA